MQVDSLRYYSRSLHSLVRAILFTVNVHEYLPLDWEHSRSFSPVAILLRPYTCTLILCLDLDMKDLSALSNKHLRNTVYPKKRPSPYGVSKSRKLTMPLLPENANVGESHARAATST